MLVTYIIYKLFARKLFCLSAANKWALIGKYQYSLGNWVVYLYSRTLLMLFN